MKSVGGQTVQGFINFQSFNSCKLKYRGEKNSKTTIFRMRSKILFQWEFGALHCSFVFWVACEMLRMQENVWTKRDCGISKMTLWDENNDLLFHAWHAVKEKCHWCNKIWNNTSYFTHGSVLLKLRFCKVWF